jgi:hypothetical protein
LCGEEKVLQDSHYIAAGFFRNLKGGKNTHPIVITPNIRMMTAEQVRAHLLCWDCEQRFHKKGEDWVLDNMWRSKKEFRLRESLGDVPRICVDPMTSFEVGDRLDLDKLVYFAASVFWRGTLKWRPLGRGERPEQLDLGPYAEELRLFLLGECDFPANVALSTFVSTLKMRLGEVHYPFRKGRDGPAGVYLYWFQVPGLTFGMWVGRGISSNTRAFCTAHSRRILAAPDVDRWNFAHALHLFSKGRKVGKLSRR